MSRHDRQPKSGELAVLDLLADAASVEEFETLLDTSRRAGVLGVVWENLQSAVRVGLRIHTQMRRTQQREAVASVLLDVARELATPYGFADLLQVITRRTRHLLELDFSYIALFDEERGILQGHAAYGHTTSLGIGLEFPSDIGLARTVLTERSPAWSPDFLADEGMARCDVLDEMVRAEGLRAVIAVPLQYGTRHVCAAPIGVLYGASRTVRQFTADERSVIGSVGALAGMAIENARLLARWTDRVSEVEEQASAARAESAATRELRETQDLLIGLALCGDPRPLAAEAGRRLGGRIWLLAVDGTVLTDDGPIPAADSSPADDRAVDHRSADGSVVDLSAVDLTQVAELTAVQATEVGGDATGPVSLGGGAWAAPILAGYDHLGAVLVGSSRPPDRGLLKVVVRAAAVLLRHGGNGAGDARGRGEILDDLLAGGSRRGHRLIRHARSLGVEPDKPSVLVLVHPEPDAPGQVAMWASAYARRGRGLATMRDGRAVLLVAGTDPGAIARAAAADLSRVLGAPVTAGGAGPLTGLDTLCEAYQEAQRCLYATTALGATGGGASARELGFVGVLLSGSHDVEAFIESSIGPVLTYDRERFSDLAKTLDAYFAAGSSPTRAAERLHVHANTVARRLDRIKVLIGPEWHTPDRALDIQLALQLHRVRAALGTSSSARTTAARKDRETP
jgi:GAF domain-containing protein